MPVQQVINLKLSAVFYIWTQSIPLSKNKLMHAPVMIRMNAGTNVLWEQTTALTRRLVPIQPIRLNVHAMMATVVTVSHALSNLSSGSATMALTWTTKTQTRDQECGLMPEEIWIKSKLENSEFLE